MRSGSDAAKRRDLALELKHRRAIGVGLIACREIERVQVTPRESGPMLQAAENAQEGSVR